MNRTDGTGWTLWWGDARRLAELDDASIDFVYISPPYYDPADEVLLRAPRAAQVHADGLRRRIAATAWSLSPVFGELGRVVRPGARVVLQSKDLRYGGRLLPVSGHYRQLMEGAGFELENRVWWRKHPDRRSRSAQSRRSGIGGAFLADDLEELMVFVRAGAKPAPVAGDLPDEWTEPVWTVPPVGRMRRHPHQTPRRLIERFIRLYTRPGDRVLDPFAGAGTTIEVAVAWGRRAVGWELDGDVYHRTAAALSERCPIP